MTFAQPIWLFVLPGALLALILLWLWAERRARHRLEAFAASNLLAQLTASYSRGRRWLKHGLVGGAVTLLLIAAARPQYGFVLEESEARGLDIMVALDTSRSMLAEDVAPNRLERSKLAVLDLLPELGGDRIGLIAFAGDAFLQAPLTLDHGAFRQTLAVTDTRSIPRGGTNIAAAIAEARASLDRHDREKLLILISDGEDLGAEGVQEARAAAAEGVRIFTVGVGSPEGAPIMITRADGQTDYVRDPEGQPVRSVLDEATLRQIAAVTEGIYVPLGNGGSGLRAVLEHVRALFPEMVQGSRLQQIPLERYQWPLAAAFLLLLLEPLIGTRRRMASTNLPGAAGLIMALVLAQPGTAEASPQRALELYQQGDYERAVHLFEAAVESSPDDARLRYNHGNALYRTGRWAEAAEAFRRALRTHDPELQGHAFFNLGNALFQLGNAEPDTLEGRKSKKAAWEEALQHFSNAGALQPAADDVSRNEAIVRQQLQQITARLAVAANPPGAGLVEPPGGLYVRGATVPLEARAREGWLFRQWEGGTVAASDQARTELTLEHDAEVTAHFVKTWQLDVLSADPEAGRAKESGRYPEDEPVTITAEAHDHYAFREWQATEGAEIQDPRSPQTQVHLTADATVTATFQDAFLLTVSHQPGIGGKAGQTGWYPVNSEVPVEAEPREGFSWSGWLGDGLQDPTVAQTTVQLDRNRAVTAVFQREWNLIVYPESEEAGVTTGSSPEPVGTRVPISVTPNEGYVFERWEGPGIADPTAPETTVTIESEEHDVVAIFRPDENQDQNDDQQENDPGNDQENDPSQDPSESSDPEDSSDPSDDSEGSDEQPDSDPEADSEQQDPGQDQESDDSDESESPEGSEADDAEESDEQPDEAEAQPAARTPGSMTEEEARQLLNILRETEQKLPVSRRSGEEDGSTLRDW